MESTTFPPRAGVRAGVAVIHGAGASRWNRTLAERQAPPLGPRRHGEGAPVVLVHSVNAAASSFEMRPLFEGLRGERPVLAFDLPGFGRSQRGPRRYDRALVLHDQDAYTDFSRLPEILRRPTWSAVRVAPTRGLPQFEQLSATLSALRAQWAPLDAEDARMDEAEARDARL